MTKILHGLPEKVTFCKRCVMSNQRPSTTPEHTKSSTDIKTAEFDEKMVEKTGKTAEEREAGKLLEINMAGMDIDLTNH